MNLMEAFKALDKLNEDVFTVDTDGIKKLQDFVHNDDTVDELDVFNLDAEPDTVIDENECHVGDAILDCCICHSKIFKPVAEVVVDEESQVANKGEECPYCYSVEGYKVVGEVKPTEEVTEVEEAELEEDIDEVNISTDDVDIEVEDKEDEALEEDIDEVNVSTDDVEIEIEDKEDSEEEAEEIEIDEEAEEVTEAIDLAAKDNTVAGILRQHMDELSSIFDPIELRNKVIEIIDSSDIADKPVADKLKKALFSKKSVGALLSTIGTYITGDKVIKTGKYKKAANESVRARKIRNRTVNELYRRKSIKESDGNEETIGDKLKKYQMWVDYDMEHYGKVSETTQDIINKEGLQLIKDQYGDYEVSVGSYKAESFKRTRKGRFVKEGLDSIEITSEDLKVSIETDDEKDNEEIVADVVEEPCEECSEEQVVAPVDEETKEKIEFDVDDIDEDAVEDAVEECLTESFSNVKFFKCSNLTARKNRIIVEGILGFKSGKKKNTSFVFRPSLKTESVVKFRGYNKDLRESAKSINLICKKTGKKTIAESLKVKK